MSENTIEAGTVDKLGKCARRGYPQNSQRRVHPRRFTHALQLR